eukprot:896942-Pelagomonas_calceolata.AAC.1
MMGKVQIHVLRQGIRRVKGMSSSDRKSVPLMICQPLTFVYSGIRSCELIPVAKVPSFLAHHKLTEVHRVTSHHSTSHQVRVCQTIQRSQEV